MALSDVLSDKTKTAPADNELSNTASDMHNAYEWKVGDPEPEGTHVQANVALRNYREDMRKGKADAASYKHNVIWVDTTKSIGDQLRSLKK